MKMYPEGVSRVPEFVRVRLLGGFRVSVGSRVIEERSWSLRKARSLVKVLALAPAHRLHREQAMDLLWPNLTAKTAANNLRPTLHAARRTLDSNPAAGSRILASSQDMLVLCPEGGLWVDADAFEEAARGARRMGEPAAYRAALDLYAGELLPEDRYEEWAEGPRARLRSTYLSLLSELAGLYEGRGDLGSAAELLWRLLAEESTSEGAHASLMRVYALWGRKAEALSQYEHLKDALAQRLGTEPSASVRALREEIAAGRFLPQEAPRHPSSDSAGALRHNLPIPRTSFVGRERELTEVKHELASTRLLTLVGAGGSGKTRLATEAARDLAGAYPDRAWLVELAPLPKGELVAQEMASVLGVREQPGKPLEQALTQHLHDKKTLLLLDNCEHLLDACAGLSDLLLATCPDLKILATSREPLGVAGEVVWRVPPLPVPLRSSTADELNEFAAVRLFVDRARLKLPAFALTVENAGAVSEVCRRLEGVPLAVELAAARMGAMAAEHLAERLEDTLGVLSSGPRTVSPRQRTMRATLEWSHGLLSEEEGAAFRRLSVFAGGFSLEAAEAVLPGEGVADGEVLRLVSALVEKSLLVADVFPGPAVAPRYRMLEPVRQYAREKLEESDEVELVLGRHAAFFLDLAEQAAPQLRGPLQVEWLERLTREHDNLRAAMAWLLEQGDSETAVQFGWALWLFWWIRGHFTEGRHWMEKALTEGGPLRPYDRAKALFVASTMATGQADFHSAAALVEESARLFEELGDERGVALARGTAGIAAVSQQRHEEGIALLEAAAGLHRKLGYEWETAVVIVLLAGTWLGLGDLGRAEQKAKEGLALAQKVGDRTGTSAALYILATVSHASGDHERAKGLFEEGIALAAEMRDEANVVYYLEQLAAVAASEGSLRRAARLWGAAEALLEAIEATAYTHRADRSLHQEQVTAARARLDETLWTGAWAEGRTMSSEQAIDYALSEKEPATPPAPMSEKRSADGRPDAITRREAEVAVLVARGLTNRRIAEKLFVSERTVDAHVRKILKKLGLRSRSQIATWTAEQQRVPPDLS